MTKRILYLLSFISVLTISGMPLAFVQLGAWLNMIGEFYQESQSISLSVEWTFNGDHPCSACQFVSEQNDSEKKDLPSMEIFSHKLKLASPNSEIISNKGLKMIGKLCPTLWHVCSTYNPMELPPPRSRA
ncbi:MAG: hypothetical protein HN548_08820 [Opitutae bacterium]|jgi:hypothetical protein|nr:hypothetical protein [Opitutae bacterium]